MKLRVNGREAFIIYKALQARVICLQTINTRNGLTAKRIKKTEALRDRLFPAPVTVPDEEAV